MVLTLYQTRKSTNLVLQTHSLYACFHAWLQQKVIIFSSLSHICSAATVLQDIMLPFNLSLLLLFCLWTFSSKKSKVLNFPKITSRSECP